MLIFDDSTGFADTSLITQGLDGEEITSADAFRCLHNPLQCLAVEICAPAVKQPVRMLSVVPL